jgi:hypothetical protein
MRKLLMFLIVALAVTTASAIHIYDGVRAPEGLYFLSYSTVYMADDVTDGSGDVVESAFDYIGVQQLLRLSWYKGDGLLTALVPLAYAESGKLDQEASGVGDVLFGAGWFLPVEWADILAMVVATAPTGEHDEDKAINVGTGQWNIRPSLFVHKNLEPYLVDAVVKYNVREENDKTDFEPGDEFYVEAMTTRRFGAWRIGPNVRWMKGDDARLDGVTVDDSAKEVFSTGIEAYTRALGWGVTLNYMADVYSENATRGHLFLLKLVRKL